MSITDNKITKHISSIISKIEQESEKANAQEQFQAFLTKEFEKESIEQIYHELTITLKLHNEIDITSLNQKKVFNLIKSELSKRRL